MDAAKSENRRLPCYCRRFEPQESRRRSWIGKFFWPVCGRYVQGSIAVGLLIFFGGAIAAKVAGFGREYLDSRIWTYAAVIAWVFAWGERSDQYLAALPERIRPALRDPTDPDFDALVKRWHKRLYSARRSLALGVVLTVALEYMTLAHPDFWQKRLPAEWSSTVDHVAWGKGILFVFFVPGGLLAGAMLLGFIDYIWFTRKVLQRELTLNLSLARVSLRHITRFGLQTGLGWSVAVALTAAFFAPERTAVATGGLVVLALMGFALILVPQVLAQEALAKTRDDLLGATSSVINAADPTTWVTRLVRDADDATLRLRAFSRELEEFPVWIYSPAQAMSFVLEVVGTIAAVLGVLHLG